MRMTVRIVVVSVVLLLAVTGDTVRAGQAATPPSRPVVDGLTYLYAGVEANVMQAAELVPESLYGYRPTPEVRSFGQIVGHIADAQKAICAAMRGGNIDLEDEFEKGATTKTAALVALKTTFAGCREIIGALTEKTVQELVPFGDQPAAVATLATFVISHNNEHYGNLVTYMRMNRIVPPSSRGSR